MQTSGQGVLVRAITCSVSPFRRLSLATCEEEEKLGKPRHYVELLWICPSTPLPYPLLPDPGLTLACHRMAALCVMPLHADFGVEIAGTMWIVLSVFSKIRITMAFAQLTHSSSLIIWASLSLPLWSHQVCLRNFFSWHKFCSKGNWN